MCNDPHLLWSSHRLRNKSSESPWTSRKCYQNVPHVFIRHSSSVFITFFTCEPAIYCRSGIQTLWWEYIQERGCSTCPNKCNQSVQSAVSDRNLKRFTDLLCHMQSWLRTCISAHLKRIWSKPSHDFDVTEIGMLQDWFDSASLIHHDLTFVSLI